MIEFDLTKPVKTAGGKEVSHLQLDFDQLSFADLRSVNTIRRMVDNTPIDDVQNDVYYQLAIAWIAAIKGGSGVALQDVIQVEMNDCFALAEVAQVDYLFRGQVYNYAKEKYSDTGNSV